MEETPPKDAAGSSEKEEQASQSLETLARMAGDTQVKPRRTDTRQRLHSTWQQTVSRTQAAKAAGKTGRPTAPHGPFIMPFWARLALVVGLALALVSLAYYVLVR